ncbi:hypothetical protein SERLA73DRAFT_191668 [Serpula lacrymans var. lacrymans S7.3]|uniref:Uncharacterized protein n=1 Tax=Serpula lacrymans var. lacrymans (strain S7.3) TaxID=936435 RepID=F8QI18_SERL3|nr:hypothetical protein SERLA73DRAFT_191668 [Serpula lacrymans var. lacrymans S7.3]
MPQSSPDGSSLSRRSRSVTPKPLTSPTIPRQMTPPIEELSASSSDSTSSSGHPTGYRTVQSLRKILDEQPSSLSLPNSASSKGKPKHLRAPSFFPRSPPPAPSSGTSTATASVSRLFTKSRHSSSTRPPSPPAHSSLKVRSVPPHSCAITHGIESSRDIWKRCRQSIG